MTHIVNVIEKETNKSHLFNLFDISASHFSVDRGCLKKIGNTLVVGNYSTNNVCYNVHELTKFKYEFFLRPMTPIRYMYLFTREYVSF